VLDWPLNSLAGFPKLNKLSRPEMFYKSLQLFLLKHGGEEIYAGPLGHHSSELIKYFEVK
jgi:hypothetical protein